MSKSWGTIWLDKFWMWSVCNDRKRKLCGLKNSWNRIFGRIFTPWNQCVLQSEPSLQWLRGCLVLLESRIKRKREKAAIPQMRKFKLFFFRFSSDAPSEPTHSISSFFYFFFSMLAPARRRPYVGGGATALLVWNDIIFSISLTCARQATPRRSLLPPSMRRRRCLAVHCHYGLCTVSDFSL